jgi:hypothetical protein
MTKNIGESGQAFDTTGSGLLVPRHRLERLEAHGTYRATLTRNGEMVWEDEFENLVTTVGKNDLLDKYFAGSAYTAAWYMGLVDGGSTPTYNAADTSASHAGWTESVAYSNATRPSVAWSGASAGSKASTAVAFTINATATIAGCFVTALSTKSGATGIMYSVGAFTAGNRAVLSLDTLSVTWTGSV